MEYKKHDFVVFSNDSQRLQANLEQSYTAWVEARGALEEMPVSMYWTAKDSVDYLGIKKNSNDNGSTVGRRNADTEGFDLAWCRGTKISLVQSTGGSSASDKSLFGALRSLDSSYRINKRKPYQAVNDDGFEVELLAAPSTHPLPGNESFEPMVSLVEQEWLLKGISLSVVVATIRNRACPLYVPDPRWMALHKLWLAHKPERSAAKKPKDLRQGEVLLDAVRYFLADSHPLNVDLVLDLPEELKPYFDAWCASRHYIPEAG